MSPAQERASFKGKADEAGIAPSNSPKESHLTRLRSFMIGLHVLTWIAVFESVVRKVRPCDRNSVSGSVGTTVQ